MSETTDTLIGLAHESLVDARSATLLIEGLSVEGMGRVRPNATSDVTLCERAGRPVLLCPAAGRLAEVAHDRCAAVLTVPTSPSGPTAGTVIFLGRLHVAAIYGSGAERTAMVELAPASIVVESSGDGGRAERVDLASYTVHCRRESCCARSAVAVGSAELHRVAERIRVHTNHQHAPALAEAAARLTGTPVETIAGAALSTVDRCGLVLDWTDGAGGHRVALSFTRPAVEPAGLSRSVREALEGTRGRG